MLQHLIIIFIGDDDAAANDGGAYATTTRSKTSSNFGNKKISKSSHGKKMLLEMNFQANLNQIFKLRYGFKLLYLS